MMNTVEFNNVNFNLIDGILTVIDPDLSDVLKSVPTEDILSELDYYEIKEWVATQEREKAEEDE